MGRTQKLPPLMYTLTNQSEAPILRSYWLWDCPVTLATTLVRPCVSVHEPSSLTVLHYYGGQQMNSHVFINGPYISHSPDTRGVTRSRATRSREIKLNDITRRVKNLSCEISELSKLLFVACRGSNAPLIRLACQNLTKEKEKKKRRRRRGSRGSSHRQPE